MNRQQLGVVAIGRNEGDRLVRCLEALQTHLSSNVPIVYVDSGSTDGSVAEAQARGVHVVELDMSIPFTGARARNAGIEYLLTRLPAVTYIQFIDGDCEILPGWVDAAVAQLASSPELAVVFGRLKERFPQASPYNQLADIEWNVPIGEALQCGGISMMRTSALQEVDGFNGALICGEEPDLCIRLRQRGWKIRCIAVDMAFHDMDMTRFSQWWTRSVRGGWAIAQGADMYGNTPERYMVRQQLSGWVWGSLMPAAACVAAPTTQGISLFLLLAYPVLFFKLYRTRQNVGDSLRKSVTYAFFLTLSKIPQAIGQAKYWMNTWGDQPAQLIEYKGS